LFLILLLFHVAQASITVVDTGQAFPSTPDKKFGQQLWKGYQYMGRLQLISTNPQLCRTNEAMEITLPKDSLPGKREREYSCSKQAYCVLYTDTFCSVCKMMIHSGSLGDQGRLQSRRKGTGCFDFDNSCQFS
jgi:hypothetical protein